MMFIMSQRVGRRFRLEELLVPDCNVYKGFDITTGEKVAIKLVDKRRGNINGLATEAEVYRLLKGSYGIADLKWYGLESDYQALVISLLGPSLRDLLDYCDGKFTLKTVLMLADQMLTRLELVHSKGYIHSGVKPANFVMGTGDKKSVCHIIDFDFSRKYMTSKRGRFNFTLSHIPYKEGLTLSGNVIYASIDNHLGIQQSRRDDIESLAYTLMHFLRGSLPWEDILKTYSGNTSISNAKRQRNNQILASKQANLPAALCRDFPKEFQDLFSYHSTLGFEDKPDYAYLRKMFRDLFVRMGFEDDGVFDWHNLDKAKDLLSSSKKEPLSEGNETSPTTISQQVAVVEEGNNAAAAEAACADTDAAGTASELSEEEAANLTTTSQQQVALVVEGSNAAAAAETASADTHGNAEAHGTASELPEEETIQTIEETPEHSQDEVLSRNVAVKDWL